MSLNVITKYWTIVFLSIITLAGFIFIYDYSSHDTKIDQAFTDIIKNTNNKAKVTLDEGFQKIVKRHMPKKTLSVSTELNTHVNEIEGLLNKLVTEPVETQKQARSLIDSKTHELIVLKEEIFRTLDENFKKQTINAEISASLTDFKQKIKQRFDKLHDHLVAVIDNDTGTNANDVIINAQNYIRSLKKPEPVAESPQPTFKIPPKPIIIEFKDAPSPAYLSSNKSKYPLVATTGDLSRLNLVLAPTVEDQEAQSCNFNSADLAAAQPEVVFDQKILDLAEELQYNPLNIYQFVANEITFQSYFGSLKGAVGTLVSGAGNATDQASLLIALLRVSKIPARYVRGTVDFDINDVRGLNWMGVKAQAAFLTVAPKGLTFDNNTRYGLSAHTWVEACVPYDNYRGSRADSSGYHWLPLDPSYEQNDYLQGTIVPELFSLNDFLYGTNGYMLKRSLMLPHEAFEVSLASYMGKAIDPVGYYATKRIIKHDILPSTLPYRVRNFSQWGDGITASETAALPQTHRFTFELTVKNNSNAIIHPLVAFDMPSISQNRVTLRFEGATQAEVDDTVCAANPQVVPVISVDGVDQAVAGKGSVDLCSVNNRLLMTIKQRETSGNINIVEYRNIGAHNYHAIQGYALQASEKLIEERSNQLLQSVGNISDPNSLQDETLGEFLHLVGLKYMDYLTKANVRIGALYDSYGVLGKHIGLASTRKSVSYLFDLPFGVSGNGFLIDVQGGQGGVYDLTTGNPVSNAFVLSGYSGSAYESYIWQEMAQLDAVSSVRGIQFANETGLSVETLTNADVLPKPWSTITLATTLNYDCPNGVYTNLTSNFNPTSLNKLSNSDTEKNTIKGLYRYNGQPYYDPLYLQDNEGNSFTCSLTTPRSQLPRNPDNDADAIAGYSETTINDIGNRLLAGESVAIPIKKIQYNNWQGSVYISVGATNASFIISGDYSAGGGYTTGTPISNSWSPSLNTGFQDLFTPTITNNLSFDTGASLDYFEPVDLGLGSNTGFVNGTTTLSGDPVNLVSGNMYHPERDIHLKGRGGLDLVFERVYNSNIRKDGPMGYGWSNSLGHKLNFFDDNDDGQTNKVIWQDGSGASFNFDVAGTSTGIATSQPFTNQAGHYVTAKRESNGEYSIKEKNGLTLYFENVAGLKDTVAKLIRVVDKNGNTTTLNYTAGKLDNVTDDLNRSLTFYYDNADQHITRIVDWSGRTYRYTYANNNLVSYETPLAVYGKENPTTYDYYVAADGTNLDHAMKSFTRPSGESMTFEYYTNGKVFRHADNKGQTFTFRYNKFRRETTTVDERGISQTYLFNERGQQILHVQGDRSRLSYEYNDANHPLSKTQSVNSLGYNGQYQYDNQGNLVSTILPDNSSYEYKGLITNSLPCTIKDAEDNYTLQRYDANGNRTDSIKLKAGTVLTEQDQASCSYVPSSTNILAWTINTYDPHGNVLTSKKVRDFVTKAGPYTEYIYDADKLNPTTIKKCGLQHDANRNLVNRCVTATQQFDDLGRMTQGVTGSFYTSQVKYDKNGRVSSSTDDLQQWHDYGYDDNGRLTSESMMASKPNGTVVLYTHNTIEYDELGRPKLNRNVAGFSSKTEYDEIGNVKKVVNPDGYTIHFEYDNKNRPTKAFDEHGHAVVTDYDIGGRPTRVTDPNNNSTTYEYYGAAENGRLRKVTTADNRAVEYFYDNSGNVIRTVDNLGRENRTDYDALNRPIRSVGPVHNSHGLSNIRQVTTTTYNELGYTTVIKAGYTTNINGDLGSDNLSIQASYGYDDFGRLITEIDANLKTTRYYYDDHNNLTRTEAANGHIVAFTYDHARNGLLKQRTAYLTASDNNPHITTYNYNPLGQLTSVTTSGVTYSYTHDKANRLVTVNDSRGNKTITYDYSPGGLLNSLQDNEGKRSDFLYDAASRLTAIQAPNGDRINFVFDAGGRLRETNIPGITSSSYSYDVGNKLRELLNRDSQGAIISQHYYGYDSVGRRDSHAENITGTTTAYTFTHDNLDRLTQVLKSGSLDESYSYDQYNNRRTRTSNGGTVDYYQYDAAQQLTQIRSGSDTGTITGSFSYDDSGNLTNKTVNSNNRIMVYDALERLVQVSGTNINTETYAYDHQDRRIEKTVGTAKSQYVYSGMSILSEYGTNWSSALAHYTYTGVDKAIIRSTSNAANDAYYHHDGLGSAVATTNNAGITQGSARYDAWGNRIAGSGMPQFGFTGREPDATGLIYYRARYYDPSMGRFTQRDPAGFVDGVNPYVYVGNSPQNFTDPLGLSAAAVTAMGSSQGSAYAGNVPRGATHNSAGGVFNDACQGSCHYATPNGDITTSADRTRLAGYARDAAMVSLLVGIEVATPYPIIPTMLAYGSGEIGGGRLSGANKTVNNGFFEVLTEAPISGASRSAHRASANKSLANELSTDSNFASGMNNLLGKDVLQHMQSGKSALKNPPGTQWHHPKDNANVMQLLKKEVHQDKSLQNYLHENGTGGFADYF